MDEVLGDDAWASPALPYIANEFTFRLGPGIDPEEIGLGDVEWTGDPPCAIISRAQAFEAVRSFNENGAEDPIRLDTAWFSSIVLVPRTPAGYPECGEVR
jgi:hypothetical protein